MSSNILSFGCTVINLRRFVDLQLEVLFGVSGEGRYILTIGRSCGTKEGGLE